MSAASKLYGVDGTGAAPVPGRINLVADLPAPEKLSATAPRSHREFWDEVARISSWRKEFERTVEARRAQARADGLEVFVQWPAGTEGPADVTPDAIDAWLTPAPPAPPTPEQLAAREAEWAVEKQELHAELARRRVERGEVDDDPVVDTGEPRL